jgi:hypothetical protein
MVLRYQARSRVLCAVGPGTIPWLGFIVYPTHRLAKARKVPKAQTRNGVLKPKTSYDLATPHRRIGF